MLRFDNPKVGFLFAILNATFQSLKCLSKYIVPSYIIINHLCTIVFGTPCSYQCNSGSTFISDCKIVVFTRLGAMQFLLAGWLLDGVSKLSSQVVDVLLL